MKICKVLMAPLCCRRSRNSKLTTMSIVDDFHTRAHFFSWIWPGCRLEVCRKKCLHIELLQLGIGGLESHCWLSPIKCHGFTITLLFVSCLQNIDEEMYWDVLKCEEMYWGGPEQQRLYCYAGLPTLLHWLGEVEAANGIYKMNVNGECPHFDS